MLVQKFFDLLMPPTVYLPHNPPQYVTAKPVELTADEMLNQTIADLRDVRDYHLAKVRHFEDVIDDATERKDKHELIYKSLNENLSRLVNHDQLEFTMSDADVPE